MDPKALYGIGVCIVILVVVMFLERGGMNMMGGSGGYNWTERNIRYAPNFQRRPGYYRENNVWVFQTYPGERQYAPRQNVGNQGDFERFQQYRLATSQ